MRDADESAPTANRSIGKAIDQKEERPRIRSAKSLEGKLTLEGTLAEHKWVEQALGSKSLEFQSYCIASLMNILPEDKDDPDYAFPLNSALAMLAAIAPKDELEAMLAVQLVAANHLALKTMRLAANSTVPLNRQLNGNLATSFSRTFVAQLEALGRHRRGGKQIVEHVHINDGGQAVFANTVNAGRGA